MPTVLIGCPVRNRAWILPEYLDALDNMHQARRFLFVENNSEDNTFSLLEEFASRHNPDCMVMSLHNQPYDHWQRGAYAHNQYRHLAELRNRFIELFLHSEYDYLLSIDSDIIAYPNLLDELLKHANQDTIVAAAISNIPDKKLDGHTPGNFMRYFDNYLSHLTHHPLTGVIDVDVTGAVYLIPRKVVEAGVRYGPHGQGEDIPFCNIAKAQGFSIKVVLDPLCEHRMVERKSVQYAMDL